MDGWRRGWLVLLPLCVCADSRGTALNLVYDRKLYFLVVGKMLILSFSLSDSCENHWKRARHHSSVHQSEPDFGFSEMLDQHRETHRGNLLPAIQTTAATKVRLWLQVHADRRESHCVSPPDQFNSSRQWQLHLRMLIWKRNSGFKS